MTAEYLNKPLFSLTVGEFLELQTKATPTVVTDFTNTAKKYLYSIREIADYCGCSKTTVNTWKAQGILAPAIQQNGRVIICDAELVIKLIGGKRVNK